TRRPPSTFAGPTQDSSPLTGPTTDHDVCCRLRLRAARLLDEVNVVDPDVGRQGRARVRVGVPLGLPVDAVDLGGDPLRLLVAPRWIDGNAVGRGCAAIAAGI